MQTETELSSVNSILGAIGQAPISRIYQKEKFENQKQLVYINPEVAIIHELLKEVDTDVVKRGDKLYDRYNHTYTFPLGQNIYFDVTWKWDLDELPSVFQRYITLRASGRAATQMVTNPQLVQLLQTQEAQARAACMEYECNQGDHTFMGTPMGTSYRSYQPYRTLAR